MKTITIRHFRTGQTLFTGNFPSIKEAVEAAIADRISLAWADLRHANLVNAQMDGAILDHARLDDANLMGANLSEASLRGTSLTNAQLYNTALCESRLQGVDMRGALFGGTDIAGAQLDHCQFDTLSALDLNFRDAGLIIGNGFTAANDRICAFSQSPLVLKGLPFPIACFENSIMVGHYALTKLPITPLAGMPSPLFNFIRNNRDLIASLWHERHPEQLQFAA